MGEPRPEDGGRERIADLAIGAALVASPLAVGTVHPGPWLGVALLAGLSLAGSLSRGTALAAPPPRLVVFYALALLAAVLPLIPLPGGVLAAVSPAADAVLSGGPLPREGFAPPHLAPGEGSFQALRFAIVGLFGAACAMRAESEIGRRRMRDALFMAGLLAAAVCVLQTALSIRAILGVYTPRWDHRRFWLAPLVNENHWAAYLMLAAAAGSGTVAALRGRVGPQLAAAVGVAGLGLMIAFGPSRSGWASAVVAAATGAALAFRIRGRRGKRARWQWLAGVAGAVAIGALGIVVRTHTFRDPLRGVARGELLDDPRIGLAKDAWNATLAHPFTGIGRGAALDTLPRFRSEPGVALFPFVESLPVQLLLDHGLPLGIALIGAALALFAGALQGGLRHRAGIPAAAAVTGLLAHELADFATHAGAVLLGGVAMSVLAMRSDGRAPWSRRRWLLGLAAPVLVFATMLPTLPHWDGARCLARQAERVSAGLQRWDEAAREESPFHPASMAQALRWGREARAAGDGDTAVRWFGRAQQLAPRHPYPHLDTARLLRDAGLRRQALIEYRLTVEGDPDRYAAAVLAEVAATWPEQDAIDAIVPSNRVEVVAQYALLLFDRSDPRADETAAAARAAAPGRPATDVLFALQRQRAGDLRGAASAAEVALAREDLLPALRLRLAAVAGQAGRLDIEAATLRDLARAGSVPSASWLALAERALDAGDDALARVAARRGRGGGDAALAVRAQLVEARLEARAGRIDAATSILRRAAEQAPDAVEVPLTEARLMADAGRDEEALNAARAAIHIAPDHAGANALVTDLSARLATKGPR